ncbi:MAG: signal peptidase I [Planctomycetota bacterium]|jgi:signal peptidase I
MNENNLNTSKEPWLAVVLSALLTGLGQIYSARVRRGCLLVSFYIVFLCVAMWFVISFTGNIIIGASLLLILGIIRIWNLFDAYKCAKRANAEAFEILRKESKDPWLAVFLSDLLPGLGQIYIKKWLSGFGFVVIFIVLLIVKRNHPSRFFGLWAVFSAFVCYHAYMSSPVRREASKRLIMIIAIVILSWELLGYTNIFFKEYFVEAFKMTGNAMEPTLFDRDRVFVRKSVKYTPKRGDIVVFKSPMEANIPYVSRVVAFEGESVEIKDNTVYINGERLKCSPLQEIEYVSTGQFAVEGKPFTVSWNSFFVLGDNSNDSLDSRFYGSVSETGLIGKAYKTYWPFKHMGLIE